MKRIAGLIAAAAMLIPTAAIADEKDPDWVGVWQGTIGKYPIIACLDTSWREGFGRGTYYYLSQLKPIPLRMEEQAPAWHEMTEDWKEGARIDWSTVSEGNLTGNWSDGKKSLPISLKPMVWQDEKTPYLPCEAPTFMAPRLKGGEVVLEAGDTDGIAFIEHEYRNPDHLDVTVQGFELMGDQPGDAKINAAVATYRPSGTIKDDWVECLSGGLAMHGRDGYFDRTVRPDLLTDEYVSVWIAGSVYCGGAHPSHFSNHRLFDRQSGAEIELENWFDTRGFVANEYGSITITAALRNVVLSLGSQDEDEADCVDIARDADWWDLALTRDGIVFKPELPHVVTACEDPIAVSWSTLDPWLSETGRAGKARLISSEG